MSHNNQTKVLFVCMGNICRSPTADAVFRQQVNNAGLNGKILVDSAGTHAYHIGEPPDRRAQSTALSRGYQMHDLRARKFTPDDFHQFDYILAMDCENLSILKQSCPANTRARVELLMEFSSQNGHYGMEVPDPYFGGQKGFDTVLDMVEDACQSLLEHITTNEK